MITICKKNVDKGGGRCQNRNMEYGIYSKIVISYFILINILSFFCFAADKKRAVSHRWRIKEATLLGLCVAGGAAGGFISIP